jgi:hypothetical protein
MSFWNVYQLSSDCTALYPRIHNSPTSHVYCNRTSLEIFRHSWNCTVVSRNLRKHSYIPIEETMLNTRNRRTYDATMASSTSWCCWSWRSFLTLCVENTKKKNYHYISYLLLQSLWRLWYLVSLIGLMFTDEIYVPSNLLPIPCLFNILKNHKIGQVCLSSSVAFGKSTPKAMLNFGEHR